jgi:hypothetical protein
MDRQARKPQTNRTAMMMKLTKPIVAGAIAVWLARDGAWGQTNPPPTSSLPPRSGQVLLPERPTAVDANVNPTSNLRPSRPERPPLSPEVQNRINRFKLEARAYLEKQEALKKQLIGANEKERAVIRERLRESREQWLERARELRKEFRERQQELLDKMPEYRELFNALRNTAQQQLQETQQETRTRRGND